MTTTHTMHTHTHTPTHALRSRTYIPQNSLTPAQGLTRIKAALADEALDAPSAPKAFDKLLQQAEADGWLPQEYSK